MGRQRGEGGGPARAASADVRADKSCGSCGRRIEWRAKWARDWDAVRWCSDACRARGVQLVDRELESSIRSLLAARPRDTTICPSEAARAVAGFRDTGSGSGSGSLTDTDGGGGDAWRALLEPALRAARRLVVAGEVEITQGGRVVDPSMAKGPIRIRRAR